jgi:hypothetical protein
MIRCGEQPATPPAARHTLVPAVVKMVTPRKGET